MVLVFRDLGIEADQKHSHYQWQGCIHAKELSNNHITEVESLLLQPLRPALETVNHEATDNRWNKDYNAEMHNNTCLPHAARNKGGHFAVATPRIHLQNEFLCALNARLSLHHEAQICDKNRT